MSFSIDTAKYIIYNDLNIIKIDDGNISEQEESLNIKIKKNEDGLLLINLKNEKNVFFNYTATIHRNNFHIMKREQSLDVDFEEFEKHLLEMLYLNLQEKKLIKCKVNSEDSKCHIIFYEKSRIKNLILLSIEMTLTSQRDLLEEMQYNIKALEDHNNGLRKKIMNMSENLKLRDQELIESRADIYELKTKFTTSIQYLNQEFLYCLKHCESLLIRKLLDVSNKIVKVVSDVNILKIENNSKSESNSRLLSRLENMRLENLDNLSLIDKLKLDCIASEKLNKNLESDVLHLSTQNKQNQNKILLLEDQIGEYRKDLENSAIAIAKKTEQFNELKADMEQANQVIRNYNKHYDSKAQEVEELIDIIKSKDQMIKEQIFQNNQIFKEFHEYKVRFNKEETEKITMELKEAQDLIKTLEKEKREMVKLNGLLTKKISSSSLFGDQRN